MLRDGNSVAELVLKELGAVSYKRNKVLKKIRRSIRNTILEEPAQEMRSLPNISTKSTTTGVTAGKDGARKSIRKQAKDAQTELKGLHCERTSALEALKRRNEQNEITELGVDQEEDLDVNSLEENDGKQHPRGEPLHWQDLLKEDMKVNIPDGVEECDAATNEVRVAFLRAFVAHTSQAISGLKCWLCQFDQMMSQGAKDKKWNLAKLEKYVKVKVHMRREQVYKVVQPVEDCRMHRERVMSLVPKLVVPDRSRVAGSP